MQVWNSSHLLLTAKTKTDAHSMNHRILSAYRSLHARPQPTAPAKAQPEAADWRRWRELTKPRRHKSFESLPEEVQQKLLVVQRVIHQYDPAAEIKLVGSWVHGGWADQHTDTEILRLRQLIKGKNGLSDIDVLVESDVELNVWSIPVGAGFELSIIQGKMRSQKGILIPRHRRSS